MAVGKASERSPRCGAVCRTCRWALTSGEAQDDALKREAAEEVGFVDNFTFKYLGSGIFDRNIIGRHENHLFLMYEIHSDNVPVLNHESESYRYFPEEELKRLLKKEPEMFGHACHFGLQAFYNRFY